MKMTFEVRNDREARKVRAVVENLLLNERIEDCLDVLRNAYSQESEKGRGRVIHAHVDRSILSDVSTLEFITRALVDCNMGWTFIGQVEEFLVFRTTSGGV